MKRLIYYTCMMLLCNNSYAQIRKAPATDDDQAEMQQINKDVVKAHIADFTEVIFKRNQDNRLDTDEVFKVTYYPKGLVKEYNSYSYETADDMMNEPPFDQIKTHVVKGNTTKYEYDDNGNVTAIKDYEVVPANSFMAVYATLGKQYELERMTNGNRTENRDPEKAKEKLQQSVAAIIRKGVPEETTLSDENEWSYDADGNTTYKTEGLDHKTSHYKYTYNAQGRPASKTEIYINKRQGSVPYFSTITYTFTYTSKGKPESIGTYLAEQDSVNIVQEKYLVRQQTFHYTEKGRTDTITYKQKGVIIKHIIAYDDTLRTGYTIIVMHPNRLDTSSYITYQYDGADLVEMKQWIYNSGRTGEYEVSRYSYNEKHLPVEMKKYVLDAGLKGEELTEQDLFFYGVKSEDKRTAKRSLREKEPERQASKQREEEHYKPANIPATKPDHVIQQSAGTQSGQTQVVQAPPPPPASSTNLKDTFNFVEKMPAFPGDFGAYLQHNLVYPKAAKKAKIEGRVFVQFAVSYTGTIASARVTKGLGYGCDEEAIRLIRSMPKWTPGTQNGRAVNVYYTVPVTFKLQ